MSIRTGVVLLGLVMAALVPAWLVSPWRHAVERRRTIVCAGDSNSTPPTGWCDVLGAALPPDQWRMVNVSLWGTSARGWLAKQSVERLVTPHRPDVVVFALGTNDVCEASAQAIVDALIALARRASQSCASPAEPCPRVMLATIPPSYLPPPIDNCRSTAARVDELLRAAWPAYLLVDFDSWVTGPEWYRADGLHFGPEGQARRADAAFLALLDAIR
jgi:lysophospholipase L1-like esterase